MIEKFKKLFVVFFFISSCKSSIYTEEINVANFPQKVKLSAHTIITKPVIFAPEAMFIVDNNLWIFQSRMDTLFSVFQLPEMQYLYSTGAKGRGPNEFIRPRFIQTLDNGFIIVDEGVEVKINEISSDGSIKTVDRLVPFAITPINGYLRLNESWSLSFAYCLTGTHGDHEYRMINHFSGEEIYFSNYPDLTRVKYEGDQRCQYYHKRLVSNQTQSLFAAFYSYFKHVRFYNYSGNLVKDIQVNIEPYRQNNIENWIERTLFYVDVVASENFIYARCISSSEEEDISNHEIQVWDWNGNPVIQYLLDRELVSFVICEKEKKIYSTDSDEGNENKIFVFDMIHLDSNFNYPR